MTQKNLRILLAEGASGEAAASLRALFQADHDRLELTIVGAISTLIPTIHVVNPEVIILDLALAQPEPLDVVRRLHRSTPAIPLIVFADARDKDNAARSLSEGAMDCIFKGSTDLQTLDRVLREALERNTLAGLADLLRDPVTGLYIRDGLLTLGERVMEMAKRNNSTLVLLCMRIENLLFIRKEFGLGVAESFLREVAQLLVGTFRRTDILSRIGESQFAAVAVDAVAPSAPVLCQRLEQRIEALNRDKGSRGALEVRMSAGFWSPGGAGSFAEFLDSVEAGLRQVEVLSDPPAQG
jgi:diguanylate cyclase (GGDEF)-like protein